ncbi:MAG: flagellar protein FlaG [Parahaliea sp.]
MITVLDQATDETIRQIPSEEALSLARFLAEQVETRGEEVDSEAVRGLLLDSQG